MIVNVPGIMIVLSSPSGAGKTTLTKLIAKNNLNSIISISHTTRQPRPSEKDGLDYYFVNEKIFFKFVKEEKFFEYAQIFDNYYGTLKEPVLKNISDGKDVLFDIDWQGTKQLKSNKNKVKLLTIFVLPPDKETLKKRLINRTEDGANLAKERMKKFEEELSHWKDYDYAVVNNKLDTCLKKILSIINLEKTGQSFIYDKSEIKNIVSKLLK